MDHEFAPPAAAPTLREVFHVLTLWADGLYPNHVRLVVRVELDSGDVAAIPVPRGCRGMAPASAHPTAHPSAHPTPPELPTPAPVRPAAWPPPAGWAFRPGEASFDGRAFALTGKLWGVLRELARRPGEPVTLDAVREAGWGDTSVEAKRVRDQVSLLRARLRDAFGLPADAEVVEDVDGAAYRLTLGA